MSYGQLDERAKSSLSRAKTFIQEQEARIASLEGVIAAKDTEIGRYLVERQQAGQSLI